MRRRAGQSRPPFFKKANAMKKLLFGSLSYESDEEYQKFKSELDQSQAAAMLVAAAAYAQGKGVYSAEESEIIIGSIRALVSPEKFREMTRPGETQPKG